MSGTIDPLHLTADERDRLLRLAAHALALDTASALTDELTVPPEESTQALLSLRRKAVWERIDADTDLLHRVLREVEETDLERIVAESSAPINARTTFLETAHCQGGIHAMLEKRLHRIPKTTRQTLRNRLRLRTTGIGRLTADHDLTHNPRNLTCATGAVMVTAGAGLSLTGGGRLGALALVAGVVLTAETS